MIQVNKSPAEAEVTERQPDVDAIRQEIEPVAEALRQGSKRNKGRRPSHLRGPQALLPLQVEVRCDGAQGSGGHPSMTSSAPLSSSRHLREASGERVKDGA